MPKRERESPKQLTEYEIDELVYHCLEEKLNNTLFEKDVLDFESIVTEAMEDGELYSDQWDDFNFFFPLSAKEDAVTSGEGFTKTTA